MIPSFRARLAALLLASAVGAIALVLGACAKKITTLDPGFTPEGRPAAGAQMIVWHEGATVLNIYRDGPPAGPFREDNCGLLSPGATDTLDRLEEFRVAPSTRIRGMILDGTPASEYRLLRRESGGTFHEFQDFSLRPVRRWRDSQWEVYAFTDALPSDFSPPTYLGRGVVGGSSTPSAPLTNPGSTSLIDVAEIAYTGQCSPADSLFTLQWAAVPGALRYWLHVYRFAQPPSAEQLLESTLPGPLNDVQPSDVFVGFVDTTHAADDVVVPPATTYRLGDTSRRDVRILLQRTMAYTEYHVRVSAVDSLGQLIAVTRGDYGLLSGAGEYALFRLRAALVSPRRRTTPQSAVAGRLRVVEAVDREGRYLRRR